MLGQASPELESTEHSPVSMKTWKGDGGEWGGRMGLGDPITATKCLYDKPKQESTSVPFLGAQQEKENFHWL